MMLRSIEYTHALCSTSTSSSFVNKPISIPLAVFISWSTECSKFENFFFNSEHSARLAESACWEALYRLRARTAACNGRFYAHSGCRSACRSVGKDTGRAVACSPGSQSIIYQTQGKPTVAYSIRAQCQAPKQRPYENKSLTELKSLL